jgi:hypothetical protein
MNNRIIQQGGIVHELYIWNGEGNYLGPGHVWIPVNGEQELRKLLDYSGPSVPAQIAEVKVTRKQIRSFVRKVL